MNRVRISTILWVGTLIGALVGSASVWAGTPELSNVRPPGAQRGTEVVFNLRGERLGDVQELLLYDDGIDVVGLETVSDKHVKATLAIAEDCRLGIHDLRVRTATGISELRTFCVGALPEVAEAEPNNSFGEPQVIPLDVTVNGIAKDEDVDYYAVQAKRGERLTAEIEGIRLGITLFDPYVAILDADRFELSRSDDAPLVRQDGIASIVVPEDGTYIIEVRESAYQGNNSCLYRLHVGRFPRPRAIYPAGGVAGTSVEVRAIGDVLGDRTVAIDLPSEAQPAPEFRRADPDHGFFDTDPSGIAPSPNPFRVAPPGQSETLEAEPNDGRNESTTAAVPGALNGIIERPGDIDHFAIEAVKGQAFDIHVRARAIRSPLDPVLNVYKADGGRVGGNDDTLGPDSFYRFQAPEDGRYIIRVQDHLGQGGPTYVYRVEVTPVRPLLRISPNNESLRRRTGVVASAIPRGNRQAILINAQRLYFGGDLLLDAPDLPDGVTMEAPTMVASQGVVPVLFHAAPDAPLGGRLTSLTAHHADPSHSPLEIAFTHESELVLGRNNINFWSRINDRMAIAVTEESPFTIRVVEPSVPLVRNGTMGLKVVAERADGFDGPISLLLPWNPPGVGSSRSITIAEGQTEAIIPLNANGNAALATWSIVIDGTATTESGPIRVSSQLVPLRVAEPYIAMNFQAVSTERGKPVDLLVGLDVKQVFDGEAEVRLVGLPNAVRADSQTIDAQTEELVFTIETGPESPVGQHKNLFCRVIVRENGEPIVHQIGSTQLQIDEPLPQKTEIAEVEAVEPEAPAAKPLSRLEKLRQQYRRRVRGEETEEPEADPQGSND